MSQRSGLSGCQVVGIVLAILLIASVCLAAGLVLGGGIGFVTGGAAGYAAGRARSARIEPHIEIPDEGWRLPEELPELPLPDAEMQPFLGVRYETVEEGARIVRVDPGSPAERAGLGVDDVILSVDGAPVSPGGPDLAARVLTYEPGDKIELRVQRGDKVLRFEVRLGARIVMERRR